MKIRIKICLFAREFLALKTEVDPFSLIAFKNAAIKILTGAVPAPQEISFSEVVKKNLKG